MLKFVNDDVAKKYTSSFKGDPVVHLPGGKTGKGFKCNLSKVTLDQADRLFAVGKQNLLQLANPTQEANGNTPVDYSSLSLKKLKEELTNRQIDFSNASTKEAMIELLTAADQPT